MLPYMYGTCYHSEVSGSLHCENWLATRSSVATDKSTMATAHKESVRVQVESCKSIRIYQCLKGSQALFTQ